MRALVVFTLLAGVVLPGSADAQTTQRPERPFRGLFGGGPPPDPNRSREELTLSGSLLGGYNDWMSPLGPDGGIQPGQEQSGGTSALAEGILRYWKGRAARSFSVDLRGGTTAQRGFSSRDAAEASARIHAATEFGPIDRLEISQDVSYEPTLAMEVLAPQGLGSGPAPLPDSGAPSGVMSQRSWFYSSGARANKNWNARHLTASSYTYSQRTYLDEFGFDMKSQAAVVQHNWSMRRSVALSGTYRFSDVRMIDPAGVETPVSDHALQFGTAYTRRLSPTRQIRLSVSGGATYVSRLSAVERLPLDYWTPVAEADGGVDLGRSWSVNANYRRAVNVLPGASLQSFATDTASLRTSGTLGSRVEAAFSVSFANGRSGGGDSVGRFETYTGAAQLRFALARWAAASVSYDYYYYRLRDILDVPTGLPPEYDRNAIRVGFSFWLPLYGSYSRGEAGRN